MRLLDVNVLVSAHRLDATRHAEFAFWLTELVKGNELFGASELVLSSFVRIVTNPRIYRIPAGLEAALDFIDALRSAPNYQQLASGTQHWRIFEGLLRRYNLTGNDVQGAYHAALAIEHDCEWVSADTGFARFAGLKWRNPFA